MCPTYPPAYIHTISPCLVYRQMEAADSHDMLQQTVATASFTYLFLVNGIKPCNFIALSVSKTPHWLADHHFCCHLWQW
jgi:hypothetical protein